MSVVAAAVIGSAVVGGVVTNNASKRAANAQENAAGKATDTQLEMFNRNAELQEPWRQAGIGALSDLTKGTQAGGDFMRDFSAADFKADPGYAFRLEQGQRALESSAAARGGLLSGGTGKALVNYGQEAGSQEFGNAYNRFNADRDRRFNRLSSIAGVGQTATRDVAQQGTNTANNVSNLQTQVGNVQAGRAISQGNAINGAIGTIGNYFGGSGFGGAQGSFPQWGTGGGFGSGFSGMGD